VCTCFYSGMHACNQVKALPKKLVKTCDAQLAASAYSYSHTSYVVLSSTQTRSSSDALHFLRAVHPLCQDPTCRVVRRISKWKAGRKVPFVTCITDLGEGHPFWFHPEVDRCFVPAENVKKDGLSSGLKPEQLAMHGLPVRQGFWNIDTSEENKKAIRTQLGLSDCKTVLVLGGGDGMGDLLGVAKGVGKGIPSEIEQRQVVIICGKNEEVKTQLTNYNWSPHREHFLALLSGSKKSSNARYVV
jgi:hypothetical protein